MLNLKDRETLIKVARALHFEMETKIDRGDYERADELGELHDEFVRLCGRLEDKDEVV